MPENSYHYLLLFQNIHIKAMNTSSESLNPVIFLTAFILYGIIITCCSSGVIYNVSGHIILRNYHPEELHTLN